MPRVARTVFVLMALACAQAKENPSAQLLSAKNGTENPEQYIICPSGKTDLRWKFSLEFGSERTKCQDSPYCSLAGAKITYVKCSNRDIASAYPRWDCSPNWAGSGFYASTSSVTCPGYSPTSPCVYEYSCTYEYTPGKSSGTVYVYSGVGGSLAIVFFAALIYCCYRRSRSQGGGMTTTTTFIRSAPYPAPVPQPTVQLGVHPGNRAAPAATFPAQQAAPPYVPPPYPPTAYPAQECPPPAYSAQAYAEPNPAFNPHYVPPDPPKQGW